MLRLASASVLALLTLCACGAQAEQPKAHPASTPATSSNRAPEPVATTPENQEPAAPTVEYTLSGAVDFCNRAKVVVRSRLLGSRQGIDSPSFSESRRQIVCEIFDKTDLDPSVLPKNKINVSAWSEDDPTQMFEDQASVTTCTSKRQNHDGVQVMTGECTTTDGVKSAVVIAFDGSSLFKISHDAFRGGTTSLPELVEALSEIAGI